MYYGSQLITSQVITMMRYWGYVRVFQLIPIMHHGLNYRTDTLRLY
jgi:hypothetical protein